MAPGDPFLNVERPNNHPFHGFRNVLQRIGQHLSVKLRLLNGGKEELAKSCLSEASFFGQAFLFLFSPKKKAPGRGMEVAPAIR